MSANVKTTWHGDRIMRQMEQAVDGTLQEAGDEAVATARRLVPVDTGRLRASIRRTEVRTAGGIAEVDVTADARNDSGDEYGIYVERGARGRPARPFIEPAAEEAGQGISAELKTRARRIR